MNIEILEGERIDDLQVNGAKIIQNPKFFCFGIDAVLISDFAKVKKKDEVCDLGCGNGIISILTAVKKSPKKVIGIEIQKHMADMAARSVLMNNLQDTVNIENIDLKKATEVLGNEKFDILITNPPYSIKNTGKRNIEDSKTIARHEILCDLEDIIKVSFKLLKHSGKLFMVHRPDRLVDIMCIMRKYKMEPKILRFVHPSIGKKPSMILMEASKCGGKELKIMEPLYVYNEDGSYTDEIMKIYFGGQKNE